LIKATIFLYGLDQIIPEVTEIIGRLSFRPLNNATRQAIPVAALRN
jgi:hypothetical protein